MTAREKAKELVEGFDETLTYLESKAKAKQCALICVDEMLNIYDSEGYDEEDSKIVYWEEVKQEINKLW